MRSLAQSFLNKHRSFIRTPVHDFRPTLLKAWGTCSPRHTRLRPLVHSRTRSTISSPPSEPDASDSTTTTQILDPILEGNEGIANPVSKVEEGEKQHPVKLRRTRTTSSGNLKDSSASPRDTNPLEFPEGLNKEILFVPSESFLDTQSSLPPLEIYEEAMDKLLVTLHPKNQAKSVLPLSGSSRPIEPTLGLYCPIEGGDNIIDSTVHELAYYTGSEVLVLDAVQLAAGECGIFGKAANALNLNPSPLHFSSVNPTPSLEPSRRRPMPEHGLEEGEGPVILTAPSRMSITIPKALSTLAGRMVVPPTSRKPSGPSRLDLFFETLVNMPCPEDLAGSTTGPVQTRPRLIYIRDFPTLAPSSSSWYPALLNAVRQRRRGLLARSSSNVTSSPVTIIFGMSPPIANPVNETSASINNLINLLTRSLIPSSSLGAKIDIVNDFSESDNAQAAREIRLRARLRKWDKYPAALQAEFPKLQTRVEGRQESPSPPIILIGGSSDSSSTNPAGMAVDVSPPRPEEDPGAQFFRSTVLVPRSRSLSGERYFRMSRRREINELTMRMGVGAIGGLIESSPAFPQSEDASPTSEAPKSPMWEEWGNKLESWSNVRKVSDRAVGSVIIQQYRLKDEEKPFVVTTHVPWTAVQSAWNACNQSGVARTKWLKETFGDKLDTQKDPEDKTLHAPGSSSDDVVASLKNDPDLDPYETRLLPCIVDANSLTTTFSHVHLPGQTIDAVRTIVSLPLLHPHAFQQGILKEHGMTGCLLFGPPGTGKTLVVRALAKEAGCRMLMVSPSDVMDMYVGEGEKLVRAVFSLARQLSPCVVFLDEIDALFGARMSARESGSAFAHRGVITEFMQEMDGLKSSKKHNVIVIGASNRPFDLDDAVLRRLPRRLLVDLPGEKEREEILKILLRDETLATDVNTNHLAKKTEGFSGSDLKHLCVSAALDSVKENMVLPWVSRHPQATISQGPRAVTSAIIEEKAEGRDDSASPSLAIEDKETDIAKLQSAAPPEVSEPTLPPRTLYLQHFTQALKEITPSSSETLGSLSDLRKWNEEFGEGRRNRRRQQVWGKGRFGFVDGQDPMIEDGRVAK